MLEAFLSPELTAFVMIIFIDLVMSGDNAIIIGMAVAKLPPDIRKKAIMWGIAGATILRIAFAVVIVHLLEIIGLKLAGGLLLAWVCWRMWKDLRGGPEVTEEDLAKAEAESEGQSAEAAKMGMRRALITIIIADFSMSLDNVLAVAGAARDHVNLLIFGLVLSIALMAVASNYIAKMLGRYPWIGYIGLAIIVYVAGDMIWSGAMEVQKVVMASS